MKKLFTLIAVVAFLAACGGNPNKKAAAAEAEAAQVEAVADSCKGECAEKEACCEGDAKVVEGETVTEGTAEI